MLMVDRVTELSEQHVRAEKLISASEPALAGHFPGRPIFPGVLIIEAMAQAAGIWAMSVAPQHQGKLMVLAGVDEVRFRKQVVPGDLLELEVRPLHVRSSMVRLAAKASVANEPVAEAVLLAAFLSLKPGEGK
jgi:3-hydroxyacyl-[acyl-carrier-protein] dehydratase